jgi:hypothetical protein
VAPLGRCRAAKVVPSIFAGWPWKCTAKQRPAPLPVVQDQVLLTHRQCQARQGGRSPRRPALCINACTRAAAQRDWLGSAPVTCMCSCDQTRTGAANKGVACSN